MELKLSSLYQTVSMLRHPVLAKRIIKNDESETKRSLFTYHPPMTVRTAYDLKPYLSQSEEWAKRSTKVVQLPR